MCFNFNKMASLHIHKRVIFSIFGTLFFLFVFFNFFNNHKRHNLNKPVNQIQHFSQIIPEKKNLKNNDLYSLSKVFFI